MKPNLVQTVNNTYIWQQEREWFWKTKSNKKRAYFNNFLFPNRNFFYFLIVKSDNIFNGTRWFYLRSWFHSRPLIKYFERKHLFHYHHYWFFFAYCCYCYFVVILIYLFVQLFNKNYFKTLNNTKFLLFFVLNILKIQFFFILVEFLITKII